MTHPAPAMGLAALAAMAAAAALGPQNRDSHLFRSPKIGDCPYFCGAVLIAAAAMALADAAHATTAADAGASAAWAGEPGEADASGPPSREAARWLYLPPEIAGRVVFYHTFSGGADRPEINRIGAKVQAAAATPQGLAGRGIDGSVHLTGLALGLNRPLTVSLWWRLREPLKPDGGFGLISLNGRGYLSNFVRSGPWCGLKEPHFVTQVYSWPNVSNVNDIQGAVGPLGADAWHHAALVVSAGSRVSTYWDGVLRSEFHVNGRMFGTEDVLGSMHLGQDGPARPMAIDEVMVLDAALGAEAVRDYVTAVRRLGAVGFPQAAGDRAASGAE